ncbi:MAG TPA: thiamine pyrophosphate-dependent enzyme [Spirochaetota bacterium]|nr:thiamine pyrophosphate-dependent enzyme [Spirochaetota bacterium]HNT10625.1 thiamine pyrophosphate-dependent enzyme [Spirochaetota bacterium]HNV49286.1 thiamine pyrophosphate-dependent enzyme [Spirochaetota bacterium]HOS40187.1 thiamine pyrophosphate-dependent enzyme [Spirochaetota bacterium]HPI23662.1 thiamine pyrophosphate-dependent enzyme [Spirochaetota bacterium]
MNRIFQRPASLLDRPTHFCPGCTHGIAHRLIAEAIDELGIRERTIGIPGVGCCVFLYHYFPIDVLEAPHGRAPACATGMKRAQPDKIIFAYQGDGDMAAIGTSEVIHAANRGENVTVFYINNSVYGMTGGQMAPTTLLGQQTTTSPYGRDFKSEGYPIRMAEMLATLEGVCYSTRVALHTPRHVNQARKAVIKALEMQNAEMGFSVVEMLSTCNTNWRVTPLEAIDMIENEMIPYYPLGVFKERTGKDFL